MWTIVKILVGILALAIFANIFVGVIKLKVVGKVISFFVSLGLIALLIYLIRAVV